MWLHNYTGFLSFLLGTSISYSNCSTKETCDRGKGLVQEVHIFCLELGKSLIPYRALILYGRKASMYVSFIVSNSQFPHTKLQCDLCNTIIGIMECALAVSISLQHYCGIYLCLLNYILQ